MRSLAAGDQMGFTFILSLGVPVVRCLVSRIRVSKDIDFLNRRTSWALPYRRESGRPATRSDSLPRSRAVGDIDYLSRLWGDEENIPLLIAVVVGDVGDPLAVGATTWAEFGAGH